MNSLFLKQASINTPLGRVVAVGDENALYLLQFEDATKVQQNIKELCIKTNATVVEGTSASIISIEHELKEYFAGTRMHFITPLFFTGTDFYKRTWQTLIQVPYGETASYRELAKAVGSPHGHRAVARANALNQMVIVVPCHRIINSNGKLGGYNAGLWRKTWLLEHENKY